MSAHSAVEAGRVAAGGSLLVGGIAGALALAPQAGAASTYTVTNTADSGAGSLRQAVLDANNNPGADIVMFDASSIGTITLTSGDIDITDDVTITGLGAADSIISGNQSANRGGGVYSKRVGNISISDSTIFDNSSNSSGAGAYIKYVGDVSIDSSTFDQNVAVDDGGGLYATVTDSFTMTNSTVSGNQGVDGAGAQLGYNGDVLIANSTFANNAGSQTAGDGGALYSWASTGDTRIMFSTFSGNSTKFVTVLLSNIGQYAAEITGTVISDNTTTEGTGTQAVDLRLAGTGAATVTSSLIMGSASGNAYIDGGGNVTGVSAQLGALADDGGSTFTMEPVTGSPVIDAGPLTWSAYAGDGSDQRGGLFLRVYDGQSDMGALEVQPEPVPPTTSTVAPSTTTTTVAPGDTTTTAATDPVVPTFTG